MEHEFDFLYQSWPTLIFAYFNGSGRPDLLEEIRTRYTMFCMHLGEKRHGREADTNWRELYILPEREKVAEKEKVPGRA